MQAWRCPTPSEPIDATVSLPGSKSLSARALLAAALADAPSQIEGLLESRDTALMRAALETLGARFTWHGGLLQVTPLVADQNRRARRLTTPPRLLTVGWRAP